MDEEKKIDIMETKVSSPPPVTWRDGAIPLLALALAWVFWENFDLVRFADFGPPHLGIAVLVACHFAAVFLALGRRARITAGALLCPAGALALGISCALYEMEPFLVVNCLVILLTAAMGTFALAGQLDPGRPQALWQTVWLSLVAFFTKLGRPFRALGQVFRGKNKRHLGTAALAVLIALPVLAVVLWLLSSADAVFGSFFARLNLSDLPADAFLRLLRVVLLGLFLASALYFIAEPPARTQTDSPDRTRRAALFLPVTALLDIVYIIFCIIQIRYLFGGAEAASMAGGWAEYARSGFFQLVTITFINLGLFLLAADPGRFTSRGGKLLRALLGLLLALTAVILVSAFWRMRLYILAFGMSVLRLLTLWAMAVVLFGLLAAAWKLIRPAFGFYRASAGFALALWCTLCLANPCGLVAGYNVDRYLSGALSELDTAYLYNLGSDVLPALQPLEKAGPEAREQYDWLLRALSEDANAPWPQWCRSVSRAGK